MLLTIARFSGLIWGFPPAQLSRYGDAANPVLQERPSMTPLTIRQIPVLKDNYCYLVHDQATGETAVVDPAVAAPVLAAVGKTGGGARRILQQQPPRDP